MNGQSRRVEFTARGIAGILGALAGGAAWWAVGYYAFVAPVESQLGGVLFLLSMLTLAPGIIAPLIVVLYFRQFVTDVLYRALLTVVGYGLMVATGYVLASLGVFQAIGITTPFEAIAFFNGLFGLVVGGIVADILVSKQFEDRGVAEDWTGTERGRRH